MEVSTAGDISTASKPPGKKSFLKRISNGFIGLLESAFYRLGYAVASYPIVTIGLCILVCSLVGIGLKDFQETNETEKLWVPASSRIQQEKKWVMENFPPFTRYSSVIITGDNVLTPRSLKAIMAYYQSVQSLRVGSQSLETMCFRVGPICRVSSILELWYYNEDLINSLTQEDILHTVNNVTISPLYHNTLDMGSLLGRVWRDSSGRITGAEAAAMLFLLYDKSKWKTKAMEWELKMVNLAKSGHRHLNHIYIYTSRSFDDEGYGAVDADVNLLMAGFSLVFVYVILTLGRFNFLHQKFYLSLAGLLSVGLAIVFAYGLAIACGILYGPVHSLMPFLLLGIGVDDMFVIVEAWRNLTPHEMTLPLVERMALSLKHAGVSVTVTSITDIVAFAIGASTVIPGLSGFCVYAALGILALYALQSTFFVACLTLDQRKVEASRDGCIPCYVHKNYTPNAFSQWNIMTTVFEKYLGPSLMKSPVKVVVVMVTSALLGVNIWGFYQLKQNFDLTMYIPSDSYAHQYAVAREEYYPVAGVDTAVYCGDLEYHKSRHLMEKMYDTIGEDPYIINGSVVFWFSAFNAWFDTVKDDPDVAEALYGDVKYPYSKAWFALLLHRFVHQTPAGQAYRQFIKFQNNTSTGTPMVKGTYFALRHTYQPDSKSEIVAMESLRHIIDNSGFPAGECFAFTENYLTYETNKILQRELYRNLLLAVICVFLITLLLIANIRTSLCVFTCVIFTLVDVAGTLHFWGVTIDTASSILLTLSVGLAVDYSAHIGHMFMTVRGTRPERVVLTLKKIGPAVFSGGFSTFLAFLLLCNSYSYGFALFFRVFFTVVVFGLFHGLIYLPVVLSWVGPEPYDTGKTTEDRSKVYKPECKHTGQGATKMNSHSEDSPNQMLYRCTEERASNNQEPLWVPRDCAGTVEMTKLLLQNSSKDTAEPDFPSSRMSFTSGHPSSPGVTMDTQPPQQEWQSMISPWIVNGTKLTLSPLWLSKKDPPITTTIEEGPRPQGNAPPNTTTSQKGPRPQGDGHRSELEPLVSSSWEDNINLSYNSCPAVIPHTESGELSPPHVDPDIVPSPHTEPGTPPNTETPPHIEPGTPPNTESPPHIEPGTPPNTDSPPHIEPAIVSNTDLDLTEESRQSMISPWIVNGTKLTLSPLWLSKKDPPITTTIEEGPHPQGNAPPNTTASQKGPRPQGNAPPNTTASQKGPRPQGNAPPNTTTSQKGPRPQGEGSGYRSTKKVGDNPTFEKGS